MCKNANSSPPYSGERQGEGSFGRPIDEDPSPNLSPEYEGEEPEQKTNMEIATHYSLTAASYARAILELAEEQKLPLEAIGDELIALRDMIKGDETFRIYLGSPAINSEVRGDLLKRVLEGQVNPVLMHTIGVMNEKGRLGLLPEVADAYADLLDQKLGKIEVDLYVANKLSPEELDAARKQISASLKRDAVVHVYVDDSLIGGSMLRIGDKLIDASVKQQLKSIKEKLLASRPS